MGFEIWRCVKLAICCSETQRTLILCSVLCIPLLRLAACRAPAPTSSTLQHRTCRAVHICREASPFVSHRGRNLFMYCLNTHIKSACTHPRLRSRMRQEGWCWRGWQIRGVCSFGLQAHKGTGEIWDKKREGGREVEGRSTFPSYNLRRQVIISPALLTIPQTASRLRSHRTSWARADAASLLRCRRHPLRILPRSVISSEVAQYPQ